MTERDPIHDLLEEAAKHIPQVVKDGDIRLSYLTLKGEVPSCDACHKPWPCLVTKLAAELHHLRKQTVCVCG